MVHRAQCRARAAVPGARPRSRSVHHRPTSPVTAAERFDAPRSEPHSAEAHLRPAKSSMPQTTIYVSPRSLGAPDERSPAVVTTDLARLFAGSPALAGVSLRIRAGGCVALLGPNGAGK